MKVAFDNTSTETVSDIEAAHNELVGRGVDATEMWHGPPFLKATSI